MGAGVVSPAERGWAEKLLASGKGSTKERGYAEGKIDRVRGMVDLPLTENGKKEASDLGAHIQRKGGVDTVSSSPLIRAKQTTLAILKHNPGARSMGTTRGLEPWHYGSLEGEPSALVHDERAHFVRNPHVPIPGVGQSGVPGESMHTFMRRFIPHVVHEVRSLKPGERKIGVSHYTNVRALRAWMKAGAKPDLSVDADEMLRKEGAPPASMFKVEPQNGKLALNEVSPHEDMGPGYFLVRHGATPYNATPNIS